ncbi:amidohydrolase family protein [Nonomuraea sp. K274]|uniref:Amidohydrolase family protein n=1 Tax=Nonomuraea cypriaca TaxID=1187855 RepID=A0A931AA52_9ACTN|nr:amidohydrolase family protein [Nonomuraea cypriaca]MBF8187434.1 amidohydrolase family protein [Nonomuraea cypriaca]
MGRRALAPVIVHSAPLVLPVCAEPVRDGAVAIRGDRVLRVGARAEVLSRLPVAREHRWAGMIVAGLVDARSTVHSTAPGVTARASVVADLTDPAGAPGITYVEVTSAGEEEWEERERDAVITAIREVDRPCAVGIAARTRHPQVLEDVAVLARTFGLRLLVDLDRHSPAALDEARVLGPLCHVACARPLDPGERKLLRLRDTVVAVCPAEPSLAPDALTLLDEGNAVAFGTGPPGPPALRVGPLDVAAAIRRHAREFGLRTRGLDRRLVEAATLGGARALGMDRGQGRIGSLAPGARADFAVFDARGRYPYAALLAQPPCLGTVVGGDLVTVTP